MTLAALLRRCAQSVGGGVLQRTGQQARAFMPRPGKSHQGARARFTLSKNVANGGVIVRGRAGAAHLNLHKSGSRLRRLGRTTVVSKADHSRMLRLLGR